MHKNSPWRIQKRINCLRNKSRRERRNQDSQRLRQRSPHWQSGTFTFRRWRRRLPLLPLPSRRRHIVDEVGITPTRFFCPRFSPRDILGGEHHFGFLFRCGFLPRGCRHDRISSVAPNSRSWIGQLLVMRCPFVNFCGRDLLLRTPFASAPDQWINEGAWPGNCDAYSMHGPGCSGRRSSRPEFINAAFKNAANKSIPLPQKGAFQRAPFLLNYHNFFRLRMIMRAATQTEPPSA